MKIVTRDINWKLYKKIEIELDDIFLGGWRALSEGGLGMVYLLQ